MVKLSYTVLIVRRAEFELRTANNSMVWDTDTDLLAEIGARIGESITGACFDTRNGDYMDNLYVTFSATPYSIYASWYRVVERLL